MKKTDYINILICSIILIICGIKWSIGLENHLDILFGDEAEYMRNDLDLFDKIAKNWGPTYGTSFYLFITLIQQNFIISIISILLSFILK